MGRARHETCVIGVDHLLLERPDPSHGQIQIDEIGIVEIRRTITGNRILNCHRQLPHGRRRPRLVVGRRTLRPASRSCSKGRKGLRFRDVDRHWSVLDLGKHGIDRQRGSHWGHDPDTPRPRRLDLNGRLVRLDLDHRRSCGDVVAVVDQPGEHRSLLHRDRQQGESQSRHAGDPPANSLSTAAATESALG